MSLTESKNGERGIFNRVAVKKKVVALGRRDADHEFGINPCSEIILRGSGGLCNLSEIVVRADDTAESLMKKAERAAILGTMQASLTNFRYLSSEWKKNAEEEALLGVSLTGIMDNPVMNGKATDEQRVKFFGSKDKLVKLEDFLVALKDRVVEVNKKWAKKLGINAAAATTCVKPSGTVSQLVNSASGIHARYSPHHIRRVRSDKKDPLGQFLKNSGFPCEDDVMSPDNNLVFSFPMKSPDCSVFRSDLTAIQQLEIWLIYDKYWCEHKVSCTIYVKDHEWLEVGAWVYKHFDEISGLSFLPHSGHVYRQAPYEECDEKTYKEALARLPKEIDWSQFVKHELEDNTTSSHELACSAGSCDLTLMP